MYLHKYAALEWIQIFVKFAISNRLFEVGPLVWRFRGACSGSEYAIDVIEMSTGKRTFGCVGRLVGYVKAMGCVCMLALHISTLVDTCRQL